MRYDIWQTEREKAEVLECGLKVTKETKDGLYMKIWKPKAKNPYCNYRFRNIEARDEYLQEQIKGHEEHIITVKQRKLQMKGTDEMVDFNWDDLDGEPPEDKGSETVEITCPKCGTKIKL